MIILGIDPGLATVGYGVIGYDRRAFRVFDYGALLTPASDRLERRLCEIYDNVIELSKRFSPDVVSVEKLFFNTNEKTAISVAEARGVILLAVTKLGIPVCEYTPLQIKQAVTGYGRAEKQQIIYMVTKLLSLKEAPKPDDTADALAAAICHAYNTDSLLYGFHE